MKILKKLLKKISTEDKFFAAIDKWMVPYLIAGRQVIWDIDTNRYVLSSNAEIPAYEHDIKPLSPKDSNEIYKHSIYSKYITESYIKDRIYKGYTAGLHLDGELVAWVLTQDDGAIAFLYVKKEHRRKGYGNSVVLSLLKRIKKSGRNPFMYIEEENERTINLAENLGFEKERRVFWLHLK